MKRIFTMLLMIAAFSSISHSQTLKPYILGSVSELSVSETAGQVSENLKSNGFKILGEYMPAGDKNRWLIVFSSEELLQAAGRVGELSGFAAALRIGITEESGKVKITYTNPEYWLNAYFRDDYSKVESILRPVSSRLDAVMKASGSWFATPFGSNEGFTGEELHSYRYMVGMQRFHNTVVLAEFNSYEDAIDKIESSLIKGVADVEKVYSLEIPGSKLKLYGFALGGDSGESKFLPVIDISAPKHTAFLPYEFLVLDNEVHMLHGRFRIAVSFPDLTMGTFTRIMSTPGDIKDLLESVVE